LVADDVRAQLRLDRVLLIPACRPPHKPEPLTPYRHRLAMTRLAVSGKSEFELCSIEGSRPGPSYTIDTLRGLQSLYADASLYLVIGSDQYRDVASWHQPDLLTDLARIVVMSRPGVEQPALFPGHDPKRVLLLSIIPVGISAAVIRARLAKGCSVRYMLPVRVAQYVRRHRLYRRPLARRTA
jgi:nicotinate-nucleotide adenylyltransferase